MNARSGWYVFFAVGGACCSAVVSQVAAQVLLPTSRAAKDPPTVVETGVEPTVDSSQLAFPVTPLFALSDLGIYDRDITTTFPPSGDAYPTDSLAVSRRDRAQAWLGRMPATEAMKGMPSVYLADVEARAGHDSLAARLFDAERAAARTPGPPAFVLATAVETFADPDRSDSALAQSVGLAERYIAQLEALPTRGYLTQRDSLGAFDRTYEAEVDLLDIEFRLGHSTEVLARGATAFAMLGRLQSWERYEKFGSDFPLEQIVTTMWQSPDGQARVEALIAHIRATVPLTAAELAAIPDSAQAQWIQSTAKRATESRLRPILLLGKSAPPVTAHVWLNTPDSLYAPTPRSRSFTDGTVRLLYFGNLLCPACQPPLPSLSRLQRQFPSGIEIIYVTNTTGTAGQVLADAPEEVQWLKTFFIERRHMTVPIAIWAPGKVPSFYGGQVPRASPMPRAYGVYHWPWVVLIDGHGIVRGYAPLGSRQQEEAVTHALAYLRGEAAHQALPVRPLCLIPPPDTGA